MIFVHLLLISITIAGKQENSSSLSPSTLIISATFPIIIMLFSRKEVPPNPNVKQSSFLHCDATGVPFVVLY